MSDATCYVCYNETNQTVVCNQCSKFICQSCFDRLVRVRCPFCRTDYPPVYRRNAVFRRMDPAEIHRAMLSNMEHYDSQVDALLHSIYQYIDRRQIGH